MTNTTASPKPDALIFQCPDCGKDIADNEEPHTLDCPRRTKPAPDAVRREALARAFWVSRGGPPENFDNHLSGKFVYEYPPFVACMRDADTALSIFSPAPAPPADGVGPAASNAAVIDLLTDIGALPPSATGAAEPVAHRWKPRGSVNWIYDPHPKWFATHKDEIDHESLYAVPPVRGDREAVIEECAKIAESYPQRKHFGAEVVEIAAKQIAERIRALSRQPPYSSSDGEGR